MENLLYAIPGLILFVIILPFAIKVGRKFGDEVVSYMDIKDRVENLSQPSNDKDN